MRTREGDGHAEGHLRLPADFSAVIGDLLRVPREPMGVVPSKPKRPRRKPAKRKRADKRR
jgi:hypothetical protein